MIRSVKITIPVCSCGIHRNGNEISLTWGLSCKSISFSWFQPIVNRAEDKSVVEVRFHAWTSMQLWDDEKLNIIRPLTRSSCRITFWCLRGIVLFYPSVTSNVKHQTKNHVAVERDVQCIRFHSLPVPPQKGASGKLPPSLVPRVPRLRCSRARV